MSSLGSIHRNYWNPHLDLFKLVNGGYNPVKWNLGGSSAIHGPVEILSGWTTSQVAPLHGKWGIFCTRNWEMFIWGDQLVAWFMQCGFLDWNVEGTTERMFLIAPGMKGYPYF